MIKLQIVGNLGKDCIVNEVNGKKVINFSVAHTERYKDGQGNQQERTTWVECAYWTDRTAVADYLKRGKMVYAEGSPSADPYMNKEGQAAATLRMRVQTIQLLGGGDGAGSNQGNVTNVGYSNNPTMRTQPQSSPSPSMANAPSMDDDLPF
ncbi:MAG: single-stranded DNA-binding protein [Chitinophagaceae bacterium]|nr:MAG: single-stranded DNA-binding protein [Chitinophagaceae bacterium]